MLARESGGIQSALQEQVSMQRMGVDSALKCLYLLVKEEVAQHTKYGSLLALTKSIGCQRSLFWQFLVYYIIWSIRSIPTL